MTRPSPTKIYNEILPQMGAFLGVFFVIMTLGYGLLYFIDFVPEAPATAKTDLEKDRSDDRVIAVTEPEDTPEVTEPETNLIDHSSDPLPVSISIDSLGRTVKVLNPASRSLAELDAALLKGVVRHPDSADFNDENGNILILGHSSYLKNVFNKNFQAFNGIQHLTVGETITLNSGDTKYTYRVDRVYEAKASEVRVPTTSDVPKLTLATCNTFGAKEDRFIVEATLISKTALN